MNDQNALDVMNGHPLCVERCRRNMTQAQLAEGVKVGVTTIWRAENDYPISATSRQRICAYFNMTSQELGLVRKKSRKGTTLVSQKVDTTLASQESSFTIIKRNQALDELSEHATDNTPKQHIGAWLALEGCNIASLFEAGWTLDAILESLRIVLQSVEGMPVMTRRKLLQLGGMAAMSDLVLPMGEKVTEEERIKLCNSLGKSISDGWKMFHTVGNAQVLAISKAQLLIIQQVHPYLSPDMRHMFYSSAYNLIGSAYFFQGHYDASWQAHDKAYNAALEGADIWNMIQSLNSQSILLSSQGKYIEAIQTIEAALNLVNSSEERFIRSKAHLLAQWAINAVMLQEDYVVCEKLSASADLLDQVSPNEEFDQSHWQHVAGVCALINKKYIVATDLFEKALVTLPQNWLIRRGMTLIPLAIAYAHEQRRDACIATAKEASSVLRILDAKVMKTRFASVQQSILDAFPNDEYMHSFLYAKQL